MLLLMATFPFVEFTLVEGFLVHSPCGNPPIFTPVSRGLSRFIDPRIIRFECTNFGGNIDRIVFINDR